MKKATAIIILIVCILLSGCGNKNYEISIAEQFGIAYAPLTIMKEQKLIEKRLPNIKVNWKQFGGPTAIREGMLSGDIDFGFMGPSPVLVGIDNGMQWKFATGISMNDVAIVTDRENIKTLADISDKERIAILSPACTQHVLLCMLAQKQLDDARVLDTKCVSLSHPDAMQSLIADTEIVAHVATPPYLNAELAQGMHTIATLDEIFGEKLTFITGVAMTKFYDENQKEFAAVMDALQEAIDYINNNTAEAVKLLAPLYGISEEELTLQMDGGTIYTRELYGIQTLSNAMQQMGFTKSSPNFNDIVFAQDKEE